MMHNSTSIANIHAIFNQLPFWEKQRVLEQLRTTQLQSEGSQHVLDTLNIPIPTFVEQDSMNENIKKWVNTSVVWSTCLYMWKKFIIIQSWQSWQSWQKKWLMFSEIIHKKSEIVYFTWIHTIAEKMSLPGLIAMKKEDMENFVFDESIFPLWNAYMSSSRHSDGFWVLDRYSDWSICWGSHQEDSTGEGYTTNPSMALRAILELY